MIEGSKQEELKARIKARIHTIEMKDDYGVPTGQFKTTISLGPKTKLIGSWWTQWSTNINITFSEIDTLADENEDILEVPVKSDLISANIASWAANEIIKDEGLLLQFYVAEYEREADKGRALGDDVQSDFASIKKIMRSLNLEYNAQNLALFGKSSRYGSPPSF